MNYGKHKKLTLTASKKSTTAFMTALSTIGWIRGVYPTRKTAEAALERGDLFVMADSGNVVAAAVINQTQVCGTKTQHGSTPRKTARSWCCTALWLTTERRKKRIWPRFRRIL